MRPPTTGQALDKTLLPVIAAKAYNFNLQKPVENGRYRLCVGFVLRLQGLELVEGHV